ncbi:MAG: glycosyltransferase family 2 protein [Abditibacteriota bacterium]|nr:glycosyltransferase family 2 protein [Abditibacteriota bacterium]
MKDNLVSIIVPVYNSEKWIDRCVDSILAQTYTNWQLILIDDGSTDNTPAILDEFKEKDDRIVVFHIKNGGVANARNVGLSAATGEFITFCDSDDCYEPDYFEILINMHKETGAELVVSSFFIDFPTKTKIKEALVLGLFKDNDISNVILNFFDTYFQALWNKLFLTKVIKDNKIDFPLHFSICEDSCFILDYISCINSVFCGDKPIYHYVQNNSSSLTKRYNKEAVDADRVVIKKLNALADKYSCNSDDFKTICENHFNKTMCKQVFSCLISNESKAEKRKVFKIFRSNESAVSFAKKSKRFSYRIIANCPFLINDIYFSLYKTKK